MEQQYQQLVKRAAKFAVIVSSSLIIIKAIAWWLTDSVTILAAMTDSLVDLFASLTNMIVLRYALQPADEDHAFGHGKAESLAALAQGAFITGSALFLLMSGTQRLIYPKFIENGDWGVAISIISIVLTAVLVWYQGYVVKKTQSPAIKADLLHYKTDVFMNGAMLVAMILNAFGFIYADGLFAIGIALYIVTSAVQMVWEAVQALLDHALPEEEIIQIKKIVHGESEAIGFHDLKTRRSGAVRFIQFHLELDDNYPLFKAHEIAERIERKLLQAFPLADIIIHEDPISVVSEELKKENPKEEVES